MSGGFATVGGKVVPMGGTTLGPKVHTGPREGQFWHHPETGNKTYGPVPAKHQKAVEAAGGPKATAPTAPKAPVQLGSSAPAGHAPRSGHPHAPTPGGHSAKGVAKGHAAAHTSGHKEGNSLQHAAHALSGAAQPGGLVSTLVHESMHMTDPMKKEGGHH